LEGIKLCKKSGENQFELRVPQMSIPAQVDGYQRLPIVGLTGSGKSTFLNLLSGLELPICGSVRWTFGGKEAYTVQWSQNGLNARAATILRLHYMGFAFQDSALIPHFTVLENLILPLRLKNISVHDAKAVAMEKLQNVLVGRENPLKISKHYPGELSGGQKQRIALVQSMIHDPLVLFADEPTGSLDKKTRIQVMDILFRWVDDGDHNRCLLWVTHHEDDLDYSGVSHVLWVEDGHVRMDNNNHPDRRGRR